jgi:hypothetical protein
LIFKVLYPPPTPSLLFVGRGRRDVFCERDSSGTTERMKREA